MSFANKIKLQSNNSNIFYMVIEDVTDRLAWYYVRVDSGKESMFEKRANDGLNLKDWGEILYSGYGEDSPEDIRQTMLSEYGFEHE